MTLARLAHENKAADLVLMSGETIGSVRGQCHSIFKIAMDRLQLWHNERLITEPGTTTLIKCGIPDGAVITVTVSAPVIKKKEVPATPLEALEREEAEMARMKAQLDDLVSLVTGAWKDELPDSAAMDEVEKTCKGIDELLTQCLLRLDSIETGSELRARRKECLKTIQALQDGSVTCVREAVIAYRGMAAKAAEAKATEEA